MLIDVQEKKERKAPKRKAASTKANNGHAKSDKFSLVIHVPMFIFILGNHGRRDGARTTSRKEKKNRQSLILVKRRRLGPKAPPLSRRMKVEMKSGIVGGEQPALRPRLVNFASEIRLKYLSDSSV